MLSDVLTADNIKVNVDAANWQESIKCAGNILKEKDVIEERYIDCMIDAVNEYGPYIVVAPGIALAHASCSSGVKSLGISLITLKEPVEFGNKQNDPVNMVFCLSATDHELHMNSLAQLATLLSREEFVNLVLNSDGTEIVNYIKSVEKEQEEEL